MWLSCPVTAQHRNFNVLLTTSWSMEYKRDWFKILWRFLTKFSTMLVAIVSIWSFRDVVNMGIIISSWLLTKAWCSKLSLKESLPTVALNSSIYCWINIFSQILSKFDRYEGTQWAKAKGLATYFIARYSIWYIWLCTKSIFHLEETNKNKLN